jgi:hypothetical protein
VSDEPAPAPEPEPAPEGDAPFDRASIRRPAWEDELGPEVESPSEPEPTAATPSPAAPEPSKPSNPRPSAPDRLGELLADPPQLPTQGALSGYREGARLRRRIGLALFVGIVAAIAIGRWYVKWLEEQKELPPTPAYQLAPGTEGESRPDALVWTEGTARLGLSNQDPGVKAIVLPDRVLTLAPGHDHAQVKVTVQGGKTVQLKVLVGEIQETSLQP